LFTQVVVAVPVTLPQLVKVAEVVRVRFLLMELREPQTSAAAAAEQAGKVRLVVGMAALG
jgi:hypothetical protein